ncbi:MAG: transposase [Fimbriimonadaceae bacterium]|nr:transposase [Fimbriimonadaceae bacterium]QYK55814.1 MAG: transposase [Fimbriimonadaceae bacterium]
MGGLTPNVGYGFAYDGRSKRRCQGLRRYPHAPTHYLDKPGSYIVTAGTYKKQHFFPTAVLLTFVVDSLLTLADRYAWKLEAYAVFSNHYHFVAETERPETLAKFLSHLHTQTARQVNATDNCPGRKVWYQYWDTFLDDEKSRYARLSYVLENPVRHGLVSRAEDYRWCSALAFSHLGERRPYVKTVQSFKTDQVRVLDDFEPLRPRD